MQRRDVANQWQQLAHRARLLGRRRRRRRPAIDLPPPNVTGPGSLNSNGTASTSATNRTVIVRLHDGATPTATPLSPVLPANAGSVSARFTAVGDLLTAALATHLTALTPSPSAPPRAAGVPSNITAFSTALNTTTSPPRPIIYIACDSGLGNKLRVVPLGVLIALASRRQLVLAEGFRILPQHFTAVDGVAAHYPPRRSRKGPRPNLVYSTIRGGAAHLGPLGCFAKSKVHAAPNCLRGLLLPGATETLHVLANQEIDHALAAPRGGRVWADALAALNESNAGGILLPTRDELAAAAVSLVVGQPTAATAARLAKLQTEVGWAPRTSEGGLRTRPLLRVGVHARLGVDSSQYVRRQRRAPSSPALSPSFWQCVGRTVEGWLLREGMQSSKLTGSSSGGADGGGGEGVRGVDVVFYFAADAPSLRDAAAAALTKPAGAAPLHGWDWICSAIHTGLGHVVGNGSTTTRSGGGGCGFSGGAVNSSTWSVAWQADAPRRFINAREAENGRDVSSVVLDFLMLSEADVIVATGSSFSGAAAARRGIPLVVAGEGVDGCGVVRMPFFGSRKMGR